MSDKKILFENLDYILRRMFKYSSILGYWGKYVWIEINLRDKDNEYKGYSGESYVLDKNKILDLGYKKICNSCRVIIYVSKYDYTENIYYFQYNNNIKEVRKNLEKIAEIAMNIEMTAIEVYNMLLEFGILNPLENYSKLLIYFRRNKPNYSEILEEINKSSIFGKSISKKVRSKEQPVYVYRAIGGKDGLSYPEGYAFSFWVYKQVNY